MSADAFVVPYLPVGTVYGPEELEALHQCLASGRTLSCGQEREAFEREFAEYLGVRHAISVANCTVALELATYLCDLRAGDEVIVTCQTYQATATPLLTGPATVRFCDIEPETLNLDPDAVASMITDRTRAIFLVHYGGDLADMAALRALADAHDVILIEDCAHAVGAHRDGILPGTSGLGCFSFQSYKNISTLGEGGMITTNDDDWADRLRRLRSIEPDAAYVPRATPGLGGYRPPPDDGVFRHEKEAFHDDCTQVRHPGTNSTLPEPAAAVGRVQLRRLPELLAARTSVADALDAGLAGIAGVRLQRRPEDAVSAHHLYTFFVEPTSAVPQAEVLAALVAQGIQVQQRYFPIHLLAEWRRLGNDIGQCPVAEDLWFHQMINLPIYPQMTTRQVNYMIEAVRRAIVGR